MWIGRVFRRICRGLASLLIETVTLVAWSVTIASSLGFAFVISAQLTRLYQKGDWNPVSASVFLQILAVPAPTSDAEFVRKVLDLVLAIPAPVLLLAIALTSYGLKSFVGHLQPPHRPAKSSKDDGDLLAAIEQALEAASKRAKL
jgi:hypothetical protein